MNKNEVCTHLSILPDIAASAYVAPGAVVLGDVVLGDLSSVWYQCVLRADIQRITIGEGSNIQDGSVIHLASDVGTTVGSYVTVGHKALLHACEVEDEVLVGMGAIVMDRARIGARSIVAAGSLVPKGMRVPEGSLVMGTPGRVVRSLSYDEQVGIRHWAEKYIAVAAAHRAFHAETSGTTNPPENPPSAESGTNPD
ncbi:MAG: gamma carbonic anhydrase family protein [Verrucomicrobiaceae bacterium]|nr:gamma carbonic anhydrase family protein [Verrucomicrobiaceae bacterium]